MLFLKEKKKKLTNISNYYFTHILFFNLIYIYKKSGVVIKITLIVLSCTRALVSNLGLLLPSWL